MRGTFSPHFSFIVLFNDFQKHHNPVRYCFLKFFLVYISIICLFICCFIFVGFWNNIFLISNLSLFFFMPFAYFFTESEGFVGVKKV